MKKSIILNLVITILAFVAGAVLYRRMPPVMASHWSFGGSVNGYLPRFWGVFAMPFLMLLLWILYVTVPLIGPKKGGIHEFRGAFDRFIVLLFMFMEYLYIVTLAWNLGFTFDFLRAVLPTFAIIYYGIGDLLAETVPNRTVGIRLPWTVRNPAVWKKTHEVGARLFKYSAAVAAVSILLPEYGLYLVFSPMLASVSILFFYSYFLARRGLRR